MLGYVGLRPEAEAARASMEARRLLCDQVLPRNREGSMKRVLGSLAAAAIVLVPISMTGSAGAQQSFKCKGQAATIVGTPGGEEVEGTNGRDVIVARAGNDRIRAIGGNDLICSGREQDNVFGGKGSDRIFTREGSDLARGGRSSDRLQAGAEDDLLIGDGGPNDICKGGRPVDDKHLRGDVADRNTCETVRGAQGLRFGGVSRAHGGWSVG